ncbi:hypothetical protein QTG54_012326 [Skeletonema marinoi]|uniref:Uncharacterized protein n=1 Tax=Skeletonema marinoi TaxID=267567 RepID=A0AAD8Y136_9STRA|nr:hypothetical protein QTG54_012325 [Skeletonema marinoi]KAK1736881.1 hypothetical protein QTG54_012326 [Skeletonema marinoi]
MMMMVRACLQSPTTSPHCPTRTHLNSSHRTLPGKPRNALKPLLQSNKKEGDVTRASMLAFNFAESSIADKTTKVVTTIMCKKKSITRSDLICLSLAVDYV